MPASDSASDVADAYRTVPCLMRCSMPSWITSEKQVRPLCGPASRPCSTAFATLPMPDCSGRRPSAGRRPFDTSYSKKSSTCAAMAWLISSGGLSGLALSRASVSTTATTLFGSTLSVG